MGAVRGQGGSQQIRAFSNHSEWPSKGSVSNAAGDLLARRASCHSGLWPAPTFARDDRVQSNGGRRGGEVAADSGGTGSAAAAAGSHGGAAAGAATHVRQLAVAASAGGALQQRYDEHEQPSRAHQLWCTTLRAMGVMTRALVPYPAFAVPRPIPTPIGPRSGRRTLGPIRV
jgi:hypothetical protein